jgi:transcriptional regulator NrdR family protein
MICPFCRNIWAPKRVLQAVVDDDGNIKTRRKCAKCGRNFATMEMVVLNVRKVLMPKTRTDISMKHRS